MRCRSSKKRKEDADQYPMGTPRGKLRIIVDEDHIAKVRDVFQCRVVKRGPFAIFSRQKRLDLTATVDRWISSPHQIVGPSQPPCVSERLRTSRAQVEFPRQLLSSSSSSKRRGSKSNRQAIPTSVPSSIGLICSNARAKVCSSSTYFPEISGF